MSNPLTVQEASEAWRIPEQTLLSAIHDRRLPAQQVGTGRRSQYIVSAADVETYAGQHRPRSKGDQAVKALISLLAEHGLAIICEAMTNPIQMLEHGWDLTRWSCRQIPGAVLFVRVVYAGHPPAPGQQPDAIVTSEPRLLMVNAPISERAKWQAIADKGDAPTTVVMAPGGVIPK